MSKSSTTTKSGQKLPPIHPGEILLEDLRDCGISINGLARAIGVAPNRIGQIVNGKRDITADTAVRLARYFGTSPQYWLNMQSHYDLRRIDQEAIARVVTPYQKSA
jgi:antitoxin HigA-1